LLLICTCVTCIMRDINLIQHVPASLKSFGNSMLLHLHNVTFVLLMLDNRRKSHICWGWWCWRLLTLCLLFYSLPASFGLYHQLKSLVTGTVYTCIKVQNMHMKEIIH